jgi:hypothetical protein
MSTSKIIAALLGPTLVATAAMVLLNLDAIPAIVDELSKSPMLIVLSLVIGLIRIVFPMQLAAIMAKSEPSLLNMMPAVAAIFLLIGGVLSYRAYVRD